ncbi:rRNA methyltransferase 3, mitochondrial [Galdieria sulphuraria]|nr:rRNA methyltransferase 3, mitochondrial [Galdieria sulphuraria]
MCQERKSETFCEGLRLVSDALKRGLKPHFILYSDDVFKSTSFHQYFSKQLFSTSIAWKTTSEVISSISDTVTCQGIVAVFEQPSDGLSHHSDLVLICDKIQDPGNLGSLLRSAAAVGVDGVIVSPESTDPYSVKVLRGGMGAQFAIPIVTCEDWKRFLQVAKDLGDISFFLADSKAEQSHYDLCLVESLAVIVSSEAHGPSCYVRQLNPVEFKIPMQNSMESLNVAVAGSVFLYEVLRQRKANQQK